MVIHPITLTIPPYNTLSYVFDYPYGKWGNVPRYGNLSSISTIYLTIVHFNDIMVNYMVGSLMDCYGNPSIYDTI